MFMRDGSSARVRVSDALMLGGLTALGPLSTDLYLPALPDVSHDFAAAMSITQLTVTACIIGLAAGQLFIGPLSDSRGRRAPLLIGILLFGFASLWSALAPSIFSLTLARFALGVSGAAGTVLALAIARDLYSGIALARCISLLMTVNFLAPAIAPALGGQLLTITTWRGVFVTLALVSAVYLVISIFRIKETLPPDRREPRSIPGTLRIFRRLLAERSFIGYALSSGFAFATGIVIITSSPFLLQGIYGLSPQSFGFALGVNALGLALMSQLNARLVRRVAPGTLLGIGVAAIALFSIGLLLTVVSGTGLVGILPALFGVTASLGLIAPNATALALAEIEAEIAGSAAALIGALQFSIGAITAPLFGLGGTQTAIPMGFGVATFGVLAWLAFLLLCRTPVEELRQQTGTSRP